MARVSTISTVLIITVLTGYYYCIATWDSWHKGCGIPSLECMDQERMRCSLWSSVSGWNSTQCFNTTGLATGMAWHLAVKICSNYPKRLDFSRPGL